MNLFLAFDLGAESGRAVLGSFNCGALQMREIHRFSNTPMRLGSTLRWDVEALWSEIARGLERAPDGLESVGVDTWGCDYALVDARGDLVEAPYCYRDARTDGVMERVFGRVPAARIYETTGIQHMPFNTLYQLAAAAEQAPVTLAQADRLLTMPDFFNSRMTGRRVCEYTNATTTQCVDARTRSWATSMIDAVGVPSRLFSELVQPGSVLGPLRPQVSGRHAGTPVVAPACHDTGSAVAAIDAGGSTAFISSGTWSLLGTVVAAPVITPEASAWNFTNEGGVAGTTRLLKNITGLWLLQSCRKRWAAEGDDRSYDDLVQAAYDHTEAFRSLIDPDDESFLHPEDMVAAIGAFCRRTNQPAPASPAAYTRTILESLALKYRFVLERLERLTGVPITTIRVIGGGARNRLLNQFTADATGRTVVAGPAEATAVGNIAMQMVATGVVSSVADARRVIELSFPVDRFTPESTGAWDAPYRRFCELV